MKTIHPVIHATKTELKEVNLKLCPCGTKQKPWMWNTGWWNISCPHCHRIVSNKYKANAIKAWSKL